MHVYVHLYVTLSDIQYMYSIYRNPLTGSIALPLAEDNPLITANNDYKLFLERRSKSAIMKMGILHVHVYYNIVKSDSLANICPDNTCAKFSIALFVQLRVYTLGTVY